MGSRIETFSRAHAGKLLQSLRQARLRGELVEVMLLEGSDWEHPQTAERLERARALESVLERLLETRAGSYA